MATYHVDPAIIYELRSWIFQLISIQNGNRMLHKYYNKRWPLVSQAGCNQGFLISPNGLGVVYHSECKCLPKYFDDPENFQAIIFDDDGSQIAVKGIAIDRGDKTLFRLGASDAYLVQWELPPHKMVNDPPRLRAEPLKVGEQVFSIGKNQQQWVIAAGEVTKTTDNNGEIETNIDCFHGFCGSPLIDVSGRICGHGATIRFESRANKEYPKRKFGLGYFDDIRHLLKGVNSEAAGIVWT